MPCINEKCPDHKTEKIIKTCRGYCMKCYHRLKKRGTLDRAYVQRVSACTHVDPITQGKCCEPTFAKNFCTKHYYENDHPLKQPWKNLRTRYKGQFPASWDSFDAFLADVPPKPEGDGQYQLRRTRVNEMWSASNMHWLLRINRPSSETTSGREYHSEYSKVWTDERRYGVSADRREKMLADQDGCCAICRKSETMINPRHPERKPRRLSIDHDHVTGAVRGLLCGRCNTTIGKRGADDSVEILRAAIAYLERHAASDKGDV